MKRPVWNWKHLYTGRCVTVIPDSVCLAVCLEEEAETVADVRNHAGFLTQCWMKSTGEYKKDAYVLSLKDMCGIKDLRGLADAGVYSLKIEGRMKQIPYAAGVVSYYRKYIDLFYRDRRHRFRKETTGQCLRWGNRCGFTDGYYHRHNGSDMVTFTKPNYEKNE